MHGIVYFVCRSVLDGWKKANLKTSKNVQNRWSMKNYMRENYHFKSTLWGMYFRIHELQYSMNAYGKNQFPFIGKGGFWSYFMKICVVVPCRLDGTNETGPLPLCTFSVMGLSMCSSIFSESSPLRSKSCIINELSGFPNSVPTVRCSVTSSNWHGHTGHAYCIWFVGKH